jgi:serine/threonine protein kinase/tetratricopeptide (TPR) repeat protein
MSAHAADRHLLFGLLALQTGLIQQAQLVAAFHAWTCDKARPLADHLVALGHLDPAQRAAIEALTAVHVEKHDGDPEKSLASLAAGRSTREQLAALGDPQVEASLAHVASGPTEPDGDRYGQTLSMSVGTATSDGQRFRVLRPHARGGLGAVFVAIDEELHREVALKQILDHHADDPTSRQRFLMEAEITGGLEHPGVVPVYGLGTYGDGRPYYAMRFIRGDSLKEALGRFHADAASKTDPGRRSLELRKLLRRFTDVCNAIEYAHSRGVLHRDIKPGNVIVGRHGETLVVDWGLAKSLGRIEPESDAGERTLRPSSASGSAETLPGSALGTPAYMSPEQAAGDLDRLGPRSDVYSLGATLYCLLTGRPPFEGDDPGVILQAVQRGEFLPPRRHDPAIDRALEAVCLRAMALKPEGRYATPRALADDVERWTADEPVNAWREPFSRRARRWARRNRTIVSSAAVALVAGVIGLTAVATVQARANSVLETKNLQLTAANAATNRALAETQTEKTKAEEALAQSEAVGTFLVEAFRSPDPEEDGRTIKVVDVLDRAAEKLDKEFAGSQATKGALLNALGRTYHGLGLYDKAEKAHTKARAVRESALGPDHPDTLQSRNNLARTYHAAGRTAEAIALQERTLRLSEAKLGPDHPHTLQSRYNLADAYRDVGRTAEAIALQERTLKLSEAKLGPDHPHTLTSRNNLALAYLDAGRAAEAVALLEATLKLREAKLGPDHPGTLISRDNLASAYYAAGRTAEAIRLHEATLRLQEAKLGPNHPDTLISRNNLANAYLAAGRTDEAVALHEQTLKLMETKLGADHPTTLASRNNLANAYYAAGRTAEALALYEATLKVCESNLGPDHPSTLTSRNNLANAYLDAGRAAEAVRMHEGTLKLYESKLGPDHPHTLGSRGSLARAYRAVGRTADAIALGEETLRLSEAKLGPDHPHTLTSRYNLAKAYRDAGRTAEAIALQERTLKLSEAKLGPDHPHTLTSRNNLALAYRDAGRAAEAVALLEATLKLREAKLGPDHPHTLTSRNNLAETYRRAGRHDLSIPMFEEVLERRTAKLGPDHPDTLVTRANLGVNYRDAGRPAQGARLLEEALRRARGRPDATRAVAGVPQSLAAAYDAAGQFARSEPLYRDALDRARKSFGPDDPRTADVMAMLGSCLLRQEKWSEAEPVLRECLALRAKTRPDAWSTYNTRSQLGGSLLGRGEFAEAEPLIVSGYEGLKARAATIPPAGKPRLTEAAERVVRLYEAWGKADQAAAWKERLGLADLPADVFAR